MTFSSVLSGGCSPWIGVRQKFRPGGVWVPRVGVSLLLLGFMGCGAAARPEPERHGGLAVVLDETFAEPEAIRGNWMAIIPEMVSAVVGIDGEEARLILPSRGEIKLSRLLEVSAVRGRRLRLTARARVDSPDASAQIAVLVGFFGSGDREAGSASLHRAKHENWASISVILDVDPDALRAEVVLVLRGKGNAWFDDVKVEVLGPMVTPPPIELSSWEVKSIAALARATALVRYRHPSDEAARLDWDAFLPVAVARVMQAHDRGALVAVLRELFKAVAPAVEFSESSTYSLAEPSGGRGHLVRWRHFGLGPHPPYVSWREGREWDHANLRVDVVAEVPLSRCWSARLEAVGRQIGDDGEAAVYAEIGQPGEASQFFDQKLSSFRSTVSVAIELPSDAYNVRLGAKASGRAGFVLEQLSFVCGDRERIEVDVGRTPWLRRGTETLYTSAVTDCGSRKCLTVERLPLDRRFQPARDVLSVTIADGLWLHMPLAVWSDGARTLPQGSRWAPTSSYAASDAPARLAITASAWGTLSLFYPYFDDLRIDWERMLSRGLARMAAAGSLTEIHNALSYLLAELHDNHARVYHPNVPTNGVLPIALRRFGSQLIVVGGLDEFRKRIPVGSEVLAIDNAPAMQAYDVVAARTSVATAGWADQIVPFWLTLGAIGKLSTVQVKMPSGETSVHVLPHLSRGIHDSLVREPRPSFGAELASGVYYVDLEQLKIESWLSIVPSLSAARVIILDMRGYPSNITFGLLGHFIGREIRSPEWQYPYLEEANTYRTSFWMIRPMKPKLNAKVIVLSDGRSGSAAETFLQIVHDNGLATLVGEASAGTNGNVNIVPLPAGFSMRFTGMRVPLADGTPLHGRGITPHHVIHPTLDGIRAGRDEVLEAAIALANRL